MSANVESMFYVREVPWHGEGVRVEEALSSAEALKIAGLDWRVTPEPVYAQNNGVFSPIPNVLANTRNTDKSVLGIVTGKYRICQNEEAFAFTDALLDNGARYETAGSLNGGKRVWVLAELPGFEILGDKVRNYIVFTTSHDGKGAIKVAIVNVRVVCENTLNLSLDTAKRTWFTKHMGDINFKMEEASRTLELNNAYTKALKEKAEKLAVKKVSEVQFHKFAFDMFPMMKEMSERQKKNVEDNRQDFIDRYFKAPDLANIRGTAWGVIQALTDHAQHAVPKRMTSTYKEKLFEQVVDGQEFVDRGYERVLELVI